MKDIQKVDLLSDCNDILIEIYAQIEKSISKKELLIREGFILWYSLVEGIHCEDFEESELIRRLQNNYRIFDSLYKEDADYLFLYGWMINVSAWQIEETMDERVGEEYLLRAYKFNPQNLLFKWAVRYKLNLNDDEVISMQIVLKLNFKAYYNFGPQIKNYFLNIFS